MTSLFDGEVFNEEIAVTNETPKSDFEINNKYLTGEVRIVTEQARYPLTSISNLFSNSINYNVHPDFQRRRRWSIEKKSKLILSFIINVPVPPVFLYEVDYAKFEVMDGLQRITTMAIAFPTGLNRAKWSFWMVQAGRICSSV
jgi:hypothetical protein